MKTSNEPLALLITGCVMLAITAIVPHDYTTWWLETFPIFIALPILVATCRRYPLTPLVYRLLFVHALVLMVGGHYTYAEVPLGYWMEDWFGFARNNYDKIGHLAQGFVPAMLFRELLLRSSPLRQGKLLFMLVAASCLAVSASYELIEWAAAVNMGQSADAFLGTQGDQWDTQSDMLMALIGAISAQLILARMQDRQLKNNRITAKAPVSHLKDSDLQKAPQALLRASEKARQLAEQTGTPFVTRKSAAVAGTLGDDFPDDITDDDLGTDAPRRDLD